MDRICIYGGTFDPVHLGHISLARDAFEQMHLDRMIFVPAKYQPFKLDKRISSDQDRLAMLRLAVNKMSGFEVSEYEANCDNISYTYLTMREMRRRFGENAALYFLTGTDTFLKIETWRNADELLTRYSYIVGTRPGYKEYELKQCMKHAEEKYGTDVTNITNEQHDISSTEIRDMIRMGRSTTDILDASVERYINTHGLYR